MIPHRIRISEEAANRLRFLRSKTGLTPNILSRFAFLLSARDMRQVSHGASELKGQEFNAPTLFGEFQEVYDMVLKRYIDATEDVRDEAVLIAHHIENGLHKMGHIRSLEDVVILK